MADAKQLWIATMNQLSIPDSSWNEKWQQLEQLYSGHSRHYHTLVHINKMCEALERFSPDGSPVELRFAIFYHDAIYDTTQQDNEEESAILATNSLADMGINSQIQSSTSKLILATKIHQALPGDLSGVSGLFLDLDLLILSAPPIEYEAYAAKIHKEYAWVPEAQYKAGRAQILNAFLGRANIYFTEEIRSEFEDKARLNIKRELDSLAMQSPSA